MEPLAGMLIADSDALWNGGSRLRLRSAGAPGKVSAASFWRRSRTLRDGGVAAIPFVRVSWLPSISRAALRSGA